MKLTQERLQAIVVSFGDKLVPIKETRRLSVIAFNIKFYGNCYIYGKYGHSAKYCRT